MSLSKWLPGSHIGFFGFWTVTLVGFEYQVHALAAHYWYAWVEAYWFSAMSLSKWLPNDHIGFFGFWTLALVKLWISKLQYLAHFLCVWVEANWFSAVWLSKWLPSGHIGFLVSRLLIKSPQSGVTLCFQFVSAASAAATSVSAAATTFASHIKTVSAKS